MIDLHSHILPGLDDGPADLEGSLALAREAVARGTRKITATPHVRDDHPYPLEAIERGVEDLNRRLTAEGIDLEVVAGGEVAISKIPDLDLDTLRRVCLGRGPYLLVESPYTQASQLLEHVLFDMQARGFRPILAHPERSPTFLTDWVRLERIVSRGVLCSVTAMSMEGAFGRTVRGFTARLFAAGMVHDVASDCHDTRRRPPGLERGFAALEQDLPGLAGQADWFAREAPEAILCGQELPRRPAVVGLRQRGLRRLFSGRTRTAESPV
jgi:protein-tyrosine phosphatase